MKLHESSPERLLQALEDRSDKLYAADMVCAEAELNLKAWESTYFMAMRDSKIAIGEAEHRIRASAEWPSMFRTLAIARVESAKAKREYQRVEVAIDMWRTVQASLRKI